jgi:hypothetical protein
VLIGGFRRAGVHCWRDPEFIAWIEGLAGDVAALTERLDAAIADGGFHEDFEAGVRERAPDAFRDETE